MDQKKRNANHELLRILAIYMITFIHANMHLGDFCTGKYWIFFNGFINGTCNIGVTCFILISGYYGIKFDIKKLIKMECMMITYSLIETVFLCTFVPEFRENAVLFEQVIKSFIPVISRKYWFYSCYVCLFCLSGFIQKMIDGFDRQEFKRLLFLLIGLFSVLPTLFYFEIIPDNGKGLVQMVMVYLVGRYIRMYHNVSIPNGKAILLFIVLWGINGISHEFPIRIGGICHHLCKDNSITNILMAIILFYLFKEIQINSVLINKVATYVFAVFAMNNALVTVVMKWWKEQGIQPYGGIGGFFVLSGLVFGILLICFAIGIIREILFGKVERKLSEMGEYYYKKYRSK